VDKLRELFIGKTQEELEKKKAFETVAALISDQPSDDTGNDELIDNRPIDFSGGSDTVMFNPGGDIDGEPLPDLDVDGVPLGDPDIDGVPLDEDIDGIPSKILLLFLSFVSIVPSLMRILSIFI
jgi:U2-associated protein SR140